MSPSICFVLCRTIMGCHSHKIQQLFTILITFALTFKLLNCIKLKSGF